MLNSVIRFALQNRLVVVFISLAVLIYGSFTAATLPIDVFPDLDRPRVVILTECPGYAAEDVETLVTIPMESALNGATGVESVRSQSGPSLSVIYVDFHWNADIYRARQIVQERLNTVEAPRGITPQLAPISSIMGQIIIIGMNYRLGPNGGRLTPLGSTSHLAELNIDPATRQATLHFWKTRDEDGRLWRNAADWKPLTPKPTAVVLEVNARPSNVEPPVSVVSFHSSDKSSFSATLPKTTNDKHSATDTATPNKTYDETPFQLKATVAGTVLHAYFPTHQESQMDLRTLADWVVRLRLLKIAGVAQVVTMGGGRLQYQVIVDPDKMNRLHIGLEDVSAALHQENLSVSGGFALQGGQEKAIRFLGRLGDGSQTVFEQLQKIPVKPTAPRNHLLKQIATITTAPEIKRGDAAINGVPGVTLTVTKQPNVDTRRVTEEIETAIRELEDVLPANIEFNPDLFQLRRFIDLGIFNVGEALVLGAVLVLIVLFLFLLNFRTTFISLTAIPLSLATTAVVFRWISGLTGTELTINVMTLGGIAVAMGELVDDAIVDVENIFRRLRENTASLSPRPVLQVVYDASKEIRSAIVFGTLMVVLVFIPLFALSGIEGRLFRPLGIAYIVSILASLLVSLTVTPVLSYYFLPGAKTTHRQTDSPLLRALKSGASVLIRLSMKRPGMILLATWLLVAGSAFLLTQLGTNFLPPFDEGSLQVNVRLPPGASLEASEKATKLVDKKLNEWRVNSEHPDRLIRQFVKRIGRAELDEHAEPVNNTEYVISLNPNYHKNRQEVINFVLEELEKLPLGADVEVEQPLQHLISHMLSGVTAQIAVKIYGDDLTKLEQAARQVQGALSDMKGIAPPVIEAQKKTEEVHIYPKPDRLAFYNMHSKQLADLIRTAFHGEVISEVVQGERRFDLVLRMDESYRKDYEKIKKLRVYPPGFKQSIPLEAVATVGPGLGPNTVNRENVRRRIVVRVNTKDRDLGSVVAEIRERVGRDVVPNLPEGYFVEYGGQFESQQRATLLISILVCVAIIGMFVVLYMLYPSARIVLQILNALPAAFIGGVLALWLTRQTLTVAGMVGFISLGGIAARNGILLVSNYFHLMRSAGESFSQSMILRGSLERLAPVLMTALTAIIALLPLIIAGHEPGREILYPVATVIVGGLVTSTLCEFLVHPGIFWRFSGKDAERLATIGEAERIAE